MYRVTKVIAADDWTLTVTFSSNDIKTFDMKPLLNCEAFMPLTDLTEFKRVRNGGYFIEWPCGADLSADTLFLDAKIS
ncbi:MAG: DUF2442 domain-containing protein [Deltaproteobacteria bacterium]|nr:DUF2442 domain-containing protein [Deltaproteobacteria bacterium]